MASNTKNIASTSKISKEHDKKWVPEGFVCVVGPDEKEYIMPEFMVPAIHHQYHVRENMGDLQVVSASGTAQENISDVFEIIGEGKLMAPTVPGSSDFERLSAHAEILSLQEALGISYKDAAHRLYMAALEKVKVDEKMFKAFTKLEEATRNSLEKAYNAINQINSTGSSTQ